MSKQSNGLSSVSGNSVGVLLRDIKHSTVIEDSEKLRVLARMAKARRRELFAYLTHLPVIHKVAALLGEWELTRDLRTLRQVLKVPPKKRPQTERKVLMNLRTLRSLIQKLNALVPVPQNKTGARDYSRQVVRLKRKCASLLYELNLRRELLEQILSTSLGSIESIEFYEEQIKNCRSASRKKARFEATLQSQMRVAGGDSKALRKLGRTLKARAACLTEFENQMIETFTPLMFRIALKYGRPPFSPGDLFQEQVFAVRKALAGFDLSRGVKFITYLQIALERTLSRYVQEGRRKLYRLGQQLPLDQPELLDREHAPVQDPQTSENVVAELFKTAKLDKREKLIIQLRFGLSCGESMTLKEVAPELGVTKERVRQIEVRAFNKLRAAAEALNLSFESIFVS